MTHQTLLIAFHKGRLGDELVPKLVGTPLALDANALKSRVLRIPTATPGVAALLLKGADLPRYVAAGVAQLGIVGSDTLDEMDIDLLELADLGFGACRLSLCAHLGVTLDDLRAKPHLRLATKFPRATEAWLAREGLTAELVPLSSSVELAEKAGKLLDSIVPSIRKTSDLVQEISAASSEQSSGAGQINAAVSQLSQTTQQNASSSEELAATAEEMSSQAEQLQQTMSFFKLDGASGGRAPGFTARKSAAGAKPVAAKKSALKASNNSYCIY